ncbi:probable 2-oxoglutarate-dependent dioxygenase AOP1 [Durio zibethinus]|uniref:Probable 2-oxoglutarate-dependent dioxygenase AOP1 n=1 Tax=Durio zibethinus TaxID=66656 RepID=A0A6P6BJB6_DURZI|nr:probable 2-oxoglutarate-dependent dioxygenase AOP1 [Durio zibethinus]
MDSQTTLKLPVIDFTKPDLKPGTVEWDLLKGQVEQALQEYSCFDALFHKIPLEIRDAIFGAMEELFDLPLQIKTRNVSELPYHGYLGQHPLVPLFESIGIEHANIVEKVEAQTSTFWPEGNTRFSKTIQSFSKQLSELDEMIRTMILEIFHLEKYIDEHMDSTGYLLRVMKYKGPKTTETQVGLKAHRDKNVVTILYQNEVHGLGVQRNDGEWIDVKPSKDSFIVTIGESLHAWLNGRLKSTYHRVMISGDKTRYSLGLFSFPKGGYIIKVPEELVDEAHPLLYKPFDYAEFLKFCCTEDGQKAHSSLKVYCGV